jgi:hippurate hydrolase
VIINLRSAQIAVIIGACLTVRAQGQLTPDELIDREIASLVSTYKTLHASPELSCHEGKTSALLAESLRSIGYTVTEHVGKYEEGSGQTGYGVVAVLKNGTGPTLLIRTDLDALPVEEKTGLPYASKAKTKTDDGMEVSVMHACGHDIHMTTLLGTARILSQLKDQWRGTLMLIGQPAEELGLGARAMLNDGLYTRFPKPDYAIALHDFPLDAGKIGIYAGYIMASATTVDITIRGIGGHGSKPESAKDPVVIAAEVILALQTIVSRENSPFDPAVVTVGSIHGGTRGNIIPDEVKLQLTVRTYKDEVRRKILSSIERITHGIAAAHGIPNELAPIVSSKDVSFEATYNDPVLTERLTGVFRKTLGEKNVVESPPIMGSEDFGLFALDRHQIPICMFFLGATDPALVAASKQNGTPLPGLHSPYFAPLPEPAIRTGVKAMIAASLELLKK